MFMWLYAIIVMYTTRQPRTQTQLIDKKVIFKNCVSFTDYISEIKTTPVDIAEVIDVLMPVPDFI